MTMSERTNSELAKDLRDLRDKLMAIYGWKEKHFKDDPRSVAGILSDAADRLVLLANPMANPPPPLDETLK